MAGSGGISPERVLTRRSPRTDFFAMSRVVVRMALRRRLVPVVKPAERVVLRRAIQVWCLLAGAGCDKPAPQPGVDSVATSPSFTPTTDSARVVEPSPWDVAAGPVFVTIGPNASTASIVVPTITSDSVLEGGRLDVSSYVGSEFDLMGNGRAVGGARISAVVPVDAPEECSGWPLVQLSGVRDDSTGRGWVVGLARGRATPVPYDSISALSSGDSSRLAIDIARIASSVPGDTVAELRGLPYQVRRAYRFTIGSGVDGLIAEVWRTLNQEANPRQEHLLIVAERDSTSRGRFDIAYTERAAGGEETLESSEILAMARFGATRDVSILLARYVGDGVIYALLERTGGRRWRLRWSSPYVGC